MLSFFCAALKATALPHTTSCRHDVRSLNLHIFSLFRASLCLVPYARSAFLPCHWPTACPLSPSSNAKFLHEIFNNSPDSYLLRAPTLLYRYLIVILIMLIILFLHDVLRLEPPESRDFIFIMFVSPVQTQCHSVLNNIWGFMGLGWRKSQTEGSGHLMADPLFCP